MLLKQYLVRKFVVVNAYIRKENILKSITFHLKKREKEEQTKCKASRQKEKNKH